ncbi:35277_t:CDS:2, partial [Racocetra persica]
MVVLEDIALEDIALENVALEDIALDANIAQAAFYHFVTRCLTNSKANL